jgi:hypothetical protein
MVILSSRGHAEFRPKQGSVVKHTIHRGTQVASRISKQKTSSSRHRPNAGCTLNERAQVYMNAASMLFCPVSSTWRHDCLLPRRTSRDGGGVGRGCGVCGSGTPCSCVSGLLFTGPCLGSVIDSSSSVVRDRQPAGCAYRCVGVCLCVCMCVCVCV